MLTHRSSKQSQGFTLVELMLSMTFVAVLLLAIALCTIQISNIYQRGLTLREVNQSSRIIIKDIQTTLNTSSPLNLETAFISLPAAGEKTAYRFCTGTYSYLINTPAALNNPSNGSTIKYEDASAGGQLPRFVRVRDTTSKYCQQVNSIYPSIAASDMPSEMLEGSDRNLAIHTLSVVQDAASQNAGMQQGSQALYTVTFVLGTTEEGTIDTSSYSCNPPADDSNNLTYCAINEFRITARAGNEI